MPAVARVTLDKTWALVGFHSAGQVTKNSWDNGRLCSVWDASLDLIYIEMSFLTVGNGVLPDDLQSGCRQRLPANVPSLRI